MVNTDSPALIKHYSGKERGGTKTHRLNYLLPGSLPSQYGYLTASDRRGGL